MNLVTNQSTISFFAVYNVMNNGFTRHFVEAGCVYFVQLMFVGKQTTNMLHVHLTVTGAAHICIKSKNQRVNYFRFYFVNMLFNKNSFKYLV